MSAIFFDIAIAAGPDPDALQRVVEAVERSGYQNYAITLWLEPDRDGDVRRRFRDDWRIQDLAFAPGGEPGVFARWNAALARSQADTIVLLTDALEPHPDCLEALRQGFAQWGPDTMAQLRIARGDACGPRLGAVALGAAFADRFDHRRCFCPDYRWFHGDTELADFARLAGCLQRANGARATGFTTPVRAMDPGHIRESRKRHRRDGRVLRQRRQAGWLWGRDPERMCALAAAHLSVDSRRPVFNNPADH